MDLISILVLILVLGLVLALCFWALDMMPMDGTLKQIGKALLVLVVVLILVSKLLPLAGVSL